MGIKVIGRKEKPLLFCKKMQNLNERIKKCSSWKIIWTIENIIEAEECKYSTG